MPGLRSLYFDTQSVSAAATDEPLPCVMKRTPCVGRLLRLDQALLRVGLVVERDDFDLLAVQAAGGVELVGEVLEMSSGRLRRSRRRRRTAGSMKPILTVSSANAGTANKPTQSATPNRPDVHDFLPCRLRCRRPLPLQWSQRPGIVQTERQPFVPATKPIAGTTDEKNMSKTVRERRETLARINAHRYGGSFCATRSLAATQRPRSPGIGASSCTSSPRALFAAASLRVALPVRRIVLAVNSAPMGWSAKAIPSASA